MGAEPREPESDPELLQDRWLVRMSHRGRVVRIVVALMLTAGGLVPVPYLGWGFFAPILCGPAAALLFYAGLERPTRRAVVFWSLPTVLGLGLGLFSLVVYWFGDGRSFELTLQVLGVSCATTLAAAVLGRPRST